MTKLTLPERDRRWKRLHEEMRIEGIDALIVGGTDYRGQKGGLRYVTNFQPFHRFGYAVLPLDREPILVLPSVLAYCPRSVWVGDYRFSPAPGTELCAVLKGLLRHDRVGLVAVDQVMRVSDHAALNEMRPAVEFVAADRLFERVRGIKSAVEIAGLEEASAIADECFDRLLQIARPGMTERAVHAEMLKVCFERGGEETLFLTMFAQVDGNDTRAVISAPGAREIAVADPFCFSFELIGPSGYWVELCRVVGFAINGRAADIATLCADSVKPALRALRPGVTGAAVQAAIDAAFDAAVYEVSAWSGHGIGQDVMEMPLIGRGATTSSDAPRFERHMAFALHPMFHRREKGPLGYVADTYILEEGGPRALSRWPLKFYGLAA